MLSLFRRNLFVNYIWLFLFTAVCLAYYGIKPNTMGLFELETPFSKYHGLEIPFADNEYFQIIFGFVLIYVQALLIADLVIKNRMSRLLSIVPGSMMVLFSVTLLQPGVIHNILIANLFYIISLGSLFKLYKKYNPVSLIFNSGFFLGVASLIYFPYFIFILGHLLGLMSLRGLKIREILQLLVAFLCPFFLMGVLMHYNHALPVMLSHYSPEFHMPEIDLKDISSLVKMILVALLLILMLVQSSHLLKKKKFDVIKKIELNYWFVLWALISLLMVEQIKDHHLLIVSAPFAILSGLFMESKQNAITKEFVFILFVAYYFSLVFDVI